MAVEVRAQVLGEKRIVLRACPRVTDVLLVIAFGSFQSNEGSREFHLGILPAQADGILDQSISVNACGGIGFARSEPLFVRFGEKAEVELRESRGTPGIGMIRLLSQPRDELFCRLWILAGVNCGAPEGFHSHQHRSA